MKSKLVGFVVSLALSSSAYAIVELQDDFSAGLSQWNQQGALVTTTSSDGNPPPCLLVDDYLNNGAWAISKKTFQYVGRQMDFSIDMKQGNAAFADQRNSCFYLSVPTWANDWSLVYLTINKNDGNVYGGMRYGATTWESFVLPISNADGWHNGHVRILTSGQLEFSVDNQLLYSTVHTIPTQFDGQLGFAPGGRRSYYDNALVESVPEPASVVLLALGGFAALRRRRA